uniref:Secreted protein n=1 Tax=Meloidogyne hapla TaxID=6305 RepID=A0A1I8B5X1_MELHA
MKTIIILLAFLFISVKTELISDIAALTSLANNLCLTLSSGCLLNINLFCNKQILSVSLLQQECQKAGWAGVTLHYGVGAKAQVHLE